MDGFINAAIFLLQTLFTIYIVIFLIRILSPNLHGEYHNNIAQFIIKMTSPLILPLRRVIALHRPVDFGALIIVFLIGLIYTYLYTWLQTFYWLDFTYALLITTGTLLHLLVSVLFWSILADALLSWIVTGDRSLHEPRIVVAHLIQPVMLPLRRVIPLIYGLDLTPFIAIILLKTIDIVLINRIVQLSLEQSFGG
jgi:YggT family protein